MPQILLSLTLAMSAWAQSTTSKTLDQLEAKLRNSEGRDTLEDAIRSSFNEDPQQTVELLVKTSKDKPAMSTGLLTIMSTILAESPFRSRGEDLYPTSDESIAMQDWALSFVSSKDPGIQATAIKVMGITGDFIENGKLYRRTWDREPGEMPKFKSKEEIFDFVPLLKHQDIRVRRATFFALRNGSLKSLLPEDRKILGESTRGDILSDNVANRDVAFSAWGQLYTSSSTAERAELLSSLETGLSASLEKEICSVLCRLVQQNLDWKGAVKKEDAFNMDPSLWEVAVSSIRAQFLVEASPFCAEARSVALEIATDLRKPAGLLHRFKSEILSSEHMTYASQHYLQLLRSVYKTLPASDPYKESLSKELKELSQKLGQNFDSPDNDIRTRGAGWNNYSLPAFQLASESSARRRLEQSRKIAEAFRNNPNLECGRLTRVDLPWV